MVARRQLSPERLRLQGDDLGRYVLRGSEAIYVGRQPVGSTAAFAGSAILTRALDFSLPNRSCQVGCAPVGPDSACGVDGVLVGIPLLDAAQGLQICTLDDLKTLTLLPLEALEAIAAREAQ
ncbi:MAG TPA: hypothetical protein VLH84_05150 [Patescibacteria group bacterium]|nr:hypothetical protein [Patescibacteria group bacterium]